MNETRSKDVSSFNTIFILIEIDKMKKMPKIKACRDKNKSQRIGILV